MNTFFARNHTQGYPPTQVPVENRSTETTNYANSFLWANTLVGLLRWLSGKESACQYRRHRRGRFNPWVRKIPWSRKQQPTPVLLPEKFHGQRSLVGCILRRGAGSQRVRHDWATEHTHIHITPWFLYFLHNWCPLLQIGLSFDREGRKKNLWQIIYSKSPGYV